MKKEPWIVQNAMRLLTGAALILFLWAVLFCAPLWTFTLVTTAFIAGGLNEFFFMVGRKGIPVERLIGLTVGILIPLSIFWTFEPTKGWELFFMTAVFILLFVFQLRRKDSSEAISGIAVTLFGIFYISWCFSFIIKLRLTGAPNLPDGRWLVAFLLLVTKGGDIGAYIIGSLFGRRTLIKRISPGKTWEGTLGGLAVSCLAALSLKPVFSAVPVSRLLILGVLLGGLGQLGDLSESIIKRDCQVKDSGRAFPGMGGVLDSIDSLLFTSPICYFFVRKFLTGA